MIIKESYNDTTALGEEIYKYVQRYQIWSSDIANEPLDAIQSNLDDLDSFWYVEDFDETELRNIIRSSIELAYDIKLYNEDRENFIELSDNHTLWKINANISEYDYVEYVNAAAEEFEQETGTPLYFLGRSGRHVCVENTYENAIRYDELCAVQNRLEDEMVYAINHNEDYMIDDE